MSLQKLSITCGLVVGLINLMPRVSAEDVSSEISGQILGEVRNTTGVVQMGAAVSLYNHADQLVRKVLSNENGQFSFGILVPDIYYIKVTLASFAPALRKNITIAAGSEERLRINLSSLLGSLELSAPTTQSGPLMTDDWKWILRSSTATRPVLRLLPTNKPPSKTAITSMFSGTTGLIRLSADDNGFLNGGGQQNMGTAFAVSTSVNGVSRVRVSGNLAYGATGLPSVGFRTTYSRETDANSVDGSSGPRVSVTVHQMYLPELAGSGSPDGNDGPVLRTVEMTTEDAMAVTDKLRVEYGFTADSVSLDRRISHFSPFSRVAYDEGKRGEVRLAFSNGAPPPDFVTAGGNTPSADLNQDLTALGQLPLISRRDGRSTLERSKTVEAGYQVKQGSRIYSAYIFRDEISDSALLISGDVDLAQAADLLPDVNSRGLVFNVGDYRRGGYTFSVTQPLGDRIELSAGGGVADALTVQSPIISDGTDLRSNVSKTSRTWVSGRAAVSVPLSRTYLATSYGWTDFHALMPTHVSLTGQLDQRTGWNIYARQPLPSIGHMKVELTVDMRNLLAQGYLSMHAANRKVILTNAPRAVRGGFNFIF